MVFGDHEYTDNESARAARQKGIEFQGIKFAESLKNFVLLSRRRVVERSFGWVSWYRRLVRYYERLAETHASLAYLA